MMTITHQNKKPMEGEVIKLILQVKISLAQLKVSKATMEPLMKCYYMKPFFSTSYCEILFDAIERVKYV